MLFLMMDDTLQYSNLVSAILLKAMEPLISLDLLENNSTFFHLFAVSSTCLQH